MSTYAFWQASLAAIRTGAARPAITNEQPEAGFYRIKRGDVWLPVAVWAVGGEMRFKFGAETVNPDRGIETWPSFAAHPITEEEYRKVAERGENWSDADPTVAAIVAQRKPTPTVPVEEDRPNGPAPFAPPDPTTEFREQITLALKGVPDYVKIESDEASARAIGLRNMLNQLAGDADKAREAEKAPHLAAAKEVDARYMPMIKDARTGAASIKAANDDWETEKRKAAAKVAAEAAEHARKVREAEAEGLLAGKPPEDVGAAPKANMPAPVAQVRPTHGRAAHIGTKLVVTAVDVDKFVAAMRPRAEWGRFMEVITEIAQKLASRGIVLDGVTTEERADTR